MKKQTQNHRVDGVQERYASTFKYQKAVAKMDYNLLLNTHFKNNTVVVVMAV